VTEQASQFEAQGIATEKVIMNPQKFAAYCRRYGIKPNNVGRLTFALSENRRLKQPRGKQ
jgi:hypothetical protein